MLRIAPAAVLFLALFLLSVALQRLSGAHSLEFAGYPDESSHYVTGVMAHDYLRFSTGANPIAYAENYYAKYPKVGLGHWPPAFYALQAAWMLLFSTSRVSVLILMALITASVAVVMALWISRYLGWLTGAVASAVFVAVPEVQSQTSMVMPELLLTAFGLLAAIAFASYVETERLRHSLLFGLFAALCILTKGNGWCIALVPPVVLVLTRRLDLMKRLSFWASVAVVALMCVPWQIFSSRYVRHVWEATGPSMLTYFRRHTVEIFMAALNCGGVIILALAVIGLAVRCLWVVIRGSKVQPQWAAMAALMMAGWVFNLAVPLGIEMRKLLVILPPMLIFAAAGAVEVARYLPAPPRVSAALAGLLALGGFMTQSFAIPLKPDIGVLQATGVLLPALSAPTTFLVSGSASTEGAFTAEVLMQDRNRSHTVLRASKVLAHSDWNGSTYVPLFSTPDDIENILTNRSVSYVILGRDFGPDAPPLHHTALDQAIREHPQEWQPLSLPRNHAGSPPVQVYQRVM